MNRKEGKGYTKKTESYACFGKLIEYSLKMQWWNREFTGQNTACSQIRLRDMIYLRRWKLGLRLGGLPEYMLD